MDNSRRDQIRGAVLTGDVPRAIANKLRDQVNALRRRDQRLQGLRNTPDDTGGFSTSSEQFSVERMIDVASVDDVSGRILYQLVRVTRPESMVELGTCLGISGAYLLAAAAANDSGFLTTCEGSPSLARLAREQLDLFGRGQYRIVEGLFNETVPRLSETLDRIDFAFIDDEHRAAATARDMKHLVPLMPDGAVVVFDDIAWGGGMADSWEGVCRRPDCAYACEPRWRGSKRLGIWVKGTTRLGGYRGRAEPIELFGPQALSRVWTIARTLQRRLKDLMDAGRSNQ